MHKKKSTLYESIIIIVQALILALIIRTLFFQPYSIPSGSMRPTLLEGDYLFVNKWSYGYSRHSLPFSPPLFSGRIWAKEPSRGDVAVFKFPADTSIDYIKRIIGLPGDKIQMNDGKLYINGSAVKREKIGKINDSDITGADYPVDLYRETLANGVSYNTLDLRKNSFSDNTREFIVPEGHYFAMGDNRDNSNDSRLDVGFIPAENLVGQANIIFFSVSDGASPLQFWRWINVLRVERFLQLIK